MQESVSLDEHGLGGKGEQMFCFLCILTNVLPGSGDVEVTHSWTLIVSLNG